LLSNPGAFPLVLAAIDENDEGHSRMDKIKKLTDPSDQRMEKCSKPVD
jgi:hypothetical protein